MVRYKFRTKPYAHQVRALRFLVRNRGGALLMEPRTGKTKTTIDYASMLAMAKKINRMVVVCPARVMGVWIEEFHRHSPLLVNIILWDADERKNKSIPTPTGHYDLHVLLVNYEAFAIPGKKLPSGRRSTASGRFKNRQKIKRWLAGKPAMCVLDESHKIKSPSSKAGTMLVSMRNDFAYRMILTGTPQTKAKRAIDIYMQWQFLNPRRFAHVPTAIDFNNRYARFITVKGEGYSYPKWTAPRNEKELRNLVHKDSFVVKRDDCFDLPPRDVRIIATPLVQSRKAYKDMAEQMVHELETGEIAEATIPLTVALRLSQITGGNVGLQEDIWDEVIDKPVHKSWVVRVGSEKLNALKELLLDEVVERDEKIVIAARFRPDLTDICSLTQSLKIPTFKLWGGMKRGDTDEAIRSFRNTTGMAAFVMQPGAGALGIDLSTAAQMVWYSLTPSWVDYTQSCDRIALSRRSTTFTYLLAPGTIDHMLYDTLQLDGDISRAILDKPERLLID